MATATSVGSCPRPVCRASGRRVHAWRALSPALPPGRADRVVASASPAGNRVLTSRDGAFHVSYGTADQLRDISDTQALAFFEPVTPVLDPIFLQYFKADVSVTLDRKYEYLDSRRFAPLVATRVAMGDSAGDPPDPRLGGRWPTRATSATMERRARLPPRRSSASREHPARRRGDREVAGAGRGRTRRPGRGDAVGGWARAPAAWRFGRRNARHRVRCARARGGGEAARPQTSTRT